MAFAITSDGHGFILHGELDMANEQALAAAFEAVLIRRTRDRRHEATRFIDSSGIKVIVAAAKAAPDACIILHGVQGSVQRVVHMTRIEQAPNIHVMPCAVGV